MIEPTTNSVLGMWVVYDHPADWPDGYIARRHELAPNGEIGEVESTATDQTLTSGDLEQLRAALAAFGLICVTRDESDDPVIVETWL